VRGKCLDCTLIFGEAYLRRILNLDVPIIINRIYSSVQKDAPLGLAIQQYGNIAAAPVRSGPHLCFAQIRVSVAASIVVLSCEDLGGESDEADHSKRWSNQRPPLADENALYLSKNRLSNTLCALRYSFQLPITVRIAVARDA